ncbi:MAG: hypothetical protein K6F76_04670 [Clostridiales bacterium]|nr:hypothetical protein [Clostridiales bacterium]
MVKKVLALVIIVLVFTFALGCKQRVIQSASDELIMYDWSYEGIGKMSAQLNFYDDDTAALTVYENGEKTLGISGKCVVSDETITIMDDSAYFDLSLNYKLTDSKCIINYEGFELPFKKTNKKE